MKSKFSTAWKASSQKRKQRKYVYAAPFHVRHELMSANLSKELRKKYSRRNIPAVKGDTVRVLSGEFRNKQGKILSVNNAKLSVEVESMQRTKKDGSKINIALKPFKLQIVELNLNDKERIASLERRLQSMKQVPEKK